MDNHITFRLIDSAAPHGEIELGDLTAIGEALQEIATRVARTSAGQAGPGRSKKLVDDASRLRLTRIGTGSTTLEIGFGSVEVLDVNSSVEESFTNRFEALLEALDTGDRPEWVDDNLGESALKLIEALAHTAPTVELTTTGGRRTVTHTKSAPRSPWATAEPTSDRELEVTGTLDLVDLRSGRFRIRDDVGHSIEFKRVPDAESIKHLIGSRVHAVGTVIMGPHGEVRALDEPTVSAQVLPAEWLSRPTTDLTAELAKPGPDPDGGIILTDEEFAAFLAAARG